MVRAARVGVASTRSVVVVSLAVGSGAGHGGEARRESQQSDANRVQSRDYERREESEMPPSGRSTAQRYSEIAYLSVQVPRTAMTVQKLR